MRHLRRGPRRSLQIAAAVAALALIVGVAAGLGWGPAVRLVDGARAGYLHLRDRASSIGDTLTRALSAATRDRELILEPERKP